MKYINEQQKYWANPYDEQNYPIAYSKYTKRSEYLLSVFSKYIDNTSTILELGCNVGRNLNALLNAGYTKISGVDINKNALRECKRIYPKMNAQLINSTIEKWALGDDKYDCIFSMAVMIHIPYESDWIFKKISKRAKKFLITIEDEKNITWKHFPRNYKKIYCRYGWKQIFTENLNGPDALKGYVTRVFRKNRFYFF